METKQGGPMYVRADYVFNIFSLVVAALSLLLSSYGIFIANRAQVYTENLEANRRSIVLVAEVGEDSDRLALAPLQSEMKFLQGYAYFPDEIISGAVPIVQEGKVRWMGTIMTSIEEYALRRTPAVEGSIVVSEGYIPIIIYSYYAFEGQVDVDWSVYNLTYLNKVGDGLPGGVKSQLTGLVYSHRLDPVDEDELSHMSNELWSSVKTRALKTPNSSQ